MANLPNVYFKKEKVKSPNVDFTPQNIYRLDSNHQEDYVDVVLLAQFHQMCAKLCQMVISPKRESGIIVALSQDIYPASSKYVSVHIMKSLEKVENELIWILLAPFNGIFFTKKEVKTFFNC